MVIQDLKNLLVVMVIKSGGYEQKGMNMMQELIVEQENQNLGGRRLALDKS